MQVECIDAMSAAMKAEGPACATQADAATALLLHNTKGLSVSNPSILSACIALFTSIAAQAQQPVFSPSAAAAIVPLLSSKLKDKKTGPSVVELFDALTASAGPWFIVSRVISFAQDSKVCRSCCSYNS